MTTSKGKHIDFIVTTSNPNDASSAADNKRRVRSRAALKSWPERRKKFFDQLEPTGACQNTFLIERPETPPIILATRPRKRKAISPTEAGAPFEDESDTATEARSSGNILGKYQLVHGSLHSWKLPTTSKSGVSRGKSSKAIISARRKRMADGSEKVSSVWDEESLPTPPYSPGSSPSNGCADPFNCYPVERQPWFDPILHHMLTIYAPRGWPSLKITNQEGLRWEQYMTQQALAEPALFYVRLYFGSGDMVHLGVVKSEIMSWLRLQAIQAINAALSDPKRATSDALILAVGRIALSESLYGDKIAASTIHRPAQKRMIEMRGGMAHLEIPALVKRLMRWSDGVMAMQTNTERLLEDDEQNRNFTLEQSVNVFHKWAPRERQSLKQESATSDLARKSSNT